MSKKLDRFLEHVLNEHEAPKVGVKDYEAKEMVECTIAVCGRS